MKHELPDYLLRSLIRHVTALIDNVDCSSSSRVANAVRLCRKEVKQIDKIINKSKDN